MNECDVGIILARVRLGETEAYEEIVRLYQRDVWKVAASMLRDIAATENLVQQAFVNAYFHLDQFRPDADFGVWIKAIARNLVREELNKRARSDEHLRGYHDYLAARLARTDEDESVRQRQADALRDCRAKLTPFAARVLSLRYEENRSFDALAQELGRTMDATRQLLCRIRLELRQCIERKEARS